MYSRYGARVFPCVEKKKFPKFKSWQDHATSDVEVIEGWATKYPTANLGVLTGTKSKLMVVDVDPRNGGNEFLEDLFEAYPVLKETAETHERTLKETSASGSLASTAKQGSMLFAEYWHEWQQECRSSVSGGWKLSQDQMYRDYVKPPLAGFCGLYARVKKYRKPSLPSASAYQSSI